MDQRDASVVARKEVLPLFPTLAWRSRSPADAREPGHHALRTLLRGMAAGLPALQRGQKWQTEGALHEQAQLRELTAFFVEQSERVLRYLRVVEAPVSLCECRAMVGAPGAVHESAGHANSFLTGIYCVEADSAGIAVDFSDPRPQAQILVPHSSGTSSVERHGARLQLDIGMLVLFPSWLGHELVFGSMANEAVVIVFDVMFPTYVESMSRPKWRGNVETHN